jgi:hypothetical protein
MEMTQSRIKNEEIKEAKPYAHGVRCHNICIHRNGKVTAQAGPQNLYGSVPTPSG